MKQYFSKSNDFVDDIKEIEYHDDLVNLKFKTNSGMFSKEHVDEYSVFLVENIPEDNYSSILDLGCGYGFIGIYLAKKFSVPVTFIDITSRACEYTKINCEINNINDFTIIESDGIQVDDTFDLIVLNPPIHAGKKIVYDLFVQALNHLSKKGKLYIVMHKNHGAKSAIKDMQEKGYSVEIISKKKSLYVIMLY